MTKIQDYKSLASLNHLQYVDQKGSKCTLKVKVNFNSESKTLHIVSTDNKTNNLVMDIDLNTKVQDHSNRTLCSYTINYMDGQKNLDGIEFGKALITENKEGKIELASLSQSFSLKQS